MAGDNPTSPPARWGDAKYGQNHVSGHNADCGAWARSAQEYGMNIARQYGAPVG